MAEATSAYLSSWPLLWVANRAFRTSCQICWMTSVSGALLDSLASLDSKMPMVSPAGAYVPVFQGYLLLACLLACLQLLQASSILLPC